MIPRQWLTNLQLTLCQLFNISALLLKYALKVLTTFMRCQKSLANPAIATRQNCLNNRLA